MAPLVYPTYTYSINRLLAVCWPQWQNICIGEEGILNDIYGKIQVMMGITFFVQAIALTLLYFTDKELKRISKSGVKQVKMLTLTKSRYLFVYTKRKEGVITRYAFRCMIAHYLLNAVVLTALSLQLIFGVYSFVIYTCCIMLAVNVGLLAAASASPGLNEKQKALYNVYLSDEVEEKDRKIRKRMSQKGPVFVTCNRPRIIQRKR